MTDAKIDLAALARRDAFCADLGIELVDSSLGRAVTQVKVAERHLNFLGACHGGLTFTLGYRERSARVQTAMSGRTALVRLVIDGNAADQPCQLSSAGELQALLLSLIAVGPQH